MVNHTYLIEPHTVGIISAAFSGGQPKGGVDEAPEALVSAGLPKQLEDLDWKVEFSGKNQKFDQFKQHNDTEGILKNPRFVGRVCEEVKKQVEDVQKRGALALTIGGDHSLAVGSIFGTLAAWEGKKEVGVIWVDAHADINTPETTASGNIHGMPVSWILGLNKTKVTGFEWVAGLKPLQKDRIVYIGLRDVDAGEKLILREHGIRAFSMHDVDKYGIGKLMQMAIDYVNPQRDRVIHLSFDVDALDPSVAPATGTPVRGGLTFREGHYICEAIHETGSLVAMDLMEVNPTLGDNAQRHQTVEIGCSLVRCALGETLL